jgi:integrase
MPKKSDWPRTVSAGSVSVKVYRVKHPGAATGFSHVVSYSTPAGRRTIKIADENEAMATARTRAAQLHAGKMDVAANITGDDLATLAEARRIVGKMGILEALSTWAKARALVGDDVLVACEHWKSRTGADAAESLTVAETVKKFLHYKRSVEKVDTKAGYERSLPSFVEALGAQPIATITPDAVDAYLSRYANAGSRNSHRKRIVAVFRWGRKRGILPLDVLTAAERSGRARNHRVEIGTVSADELTRAFALVAEKAANDKRDEYLVSLALAAFCGLRSAEVHGQDWKDVDLGRKLLRVSAGKANTPARRLVTIPDACHAWLLPHRQEAGPICSNLAIDRVRDICRTANLRLAKNGLRHTFISARIAVTGDVAATSLEAGNSPAMVHAHYRELLRRDEGEAWFAVAPPTPEGNVIAIGSGREVRRA